MTATARIQRVELSVPTAPPVTNPTARVYRTELSVPDAGTVAVTARIHSTTFSVPSPSQVTGIRDSFNRSNNSSSLGQTETGQVWQVSGGTWGISNQKAKTIT